MTDDNMRIADKQAMIDWVADGETPKSDWKIGTEHEKFLYRCDTKEPVVYEGPDGVAQLLSNLLIELGSAATPREDRAIDPATITSKAKAKVVLAFDKAKSTILIIRQSGKLFAPSHHF